MFLTVGADALRTCRGATRTPVTDTRMTFESLGLSARLVQHTQRAGFTNPTPIQTAAIPVALTGRDLLGCAQTGTGKTAAFVLPTAQRLANDPAGVALVLAPTRELAQQIADTVRLLTDDGNRVACILGGASMNQQIHTLRAAPRWIIATPGRLIDHIDRGSVRLANVRVLVLDEADRMLDMGFAPQLRRILAVIPTERQTLLFSATMPSPGDPGWRDVLKAGLRDPMRVAVDPPRVAARAEQSLWLVEQASKTNALTALLRDEAGSVLVFTRTKHRADRVARQLGQAGFTADRIHGDRSQGQRERALAGFRSGEVRILVATDIAARGIDVDGVTHVVNYDLPTDAEDYVHRIGRTARAQRSGRATSFVMPDEHDALRIIERLVGERLPAVQDRRAEFPAPPPLPGRPMPPPSSNVRGSQPSNNRPMQSSNGRGPQSNGRPAQPSNGRGPQSSNGRPSQSSNGRPPQAPRHAASHHNPPPRHP